MRWNFPACGEVRTADETPGSTPLLIQSSEGAAWAVNLIPLKANEKPAISSHSPRFGRFGERGQGGEG